MPGEQQQITIDPQHVINAQRGKIETMSNEIVMLEAYVNQQAEVIRQLHQQIADANKDKEASYGDQGTEESPIDQAG